MHETNKYLTVINHMRYFNGLSYLSQEGSDQPKEYEDILAKCVFPEGREEVEEKFLVNINGKKSAWLCKNCQSYLQKNKMPPKSHRNNLEIVHVPQLVELTQFENMLIGTEIPFMFITKLPVSRMDAVKGKLTLVPIQEEDVRATVQAGQALPRTPGMLK